MRTSSGKAQLLQPVQEAVRPALVAGVLRAGIYQQHPVPGTQELGSDLSRQTAGPVGILPHEAQPLTAGDIRVEGDHRDPPLRQLRQITADGRTVRSAQGDALDSLCFQLLQMTQALRRPSLVIGPHRDGEVVVPSLLPKLGDAGGNGLPHSPPRWAAPQQSGGWCRSAPGRWPYGLAGSPALPLPGGPAPVPPASHRVGYGAPGPPYRWKRPPAPRSF